MNNVLFLGACVALLIAVALVALFRPARPSYPPGPYANERSEGCDMCENGRYPCHCNNGLT